MAVDAFVALAEPTRRRILAELRSGDRSVNHLVRTLAVGQPTVSKHLKVLREAGFVSARVAAQQRIYHIEAEPFVALERWLEPYRLLWTTHLDRLEHHLDNLEEEQ